MSATQPFHASVKSHDQLVHLADCHTQTVQAWLSSRSPNAVQLERKGVKLSSTGLRVPLLNLALGCNFPADATDEEINSEIAAIKAFFTRRGVPWLWWIGPNATPANMAHHLHEHGLAARPRKLPAMIAPLDTTVRPKMSSAHEIKVWRAQSNADLRAASHIRHQAFRFPPGQALHYFENMAADWLSDTSPARLFLAGRQTNAPVAIGAVIEGAGLPGIYIMATLPECTRQGYGKAILAHLLQYIKEQNKGDTMVVLTASAYGFPLYAQFGFKHLFDYSIYTETA